MAALAQLPHHVIKVAAKIANFVIAPSETDSDIHIAITYLGDLFLQFDHRPLYEIGEDEHGYGADDDRSSTGENQNGMTFRIPQRNGCECE